ncbi:MAG: M48 family metalloprotease [Vicinamibacterales bacterium]
MRCSAPVVSVLIACALIAAPRAQAPAPAGSLDEVVARAQQAEAAVLDNLKTLKPLMEIYLQDVLADDSLAVTPRSDTYLLGRFEFRRGPRLLPLSGDGSLERMSASTPEGRNVRYVPDGFAAMAAPDWDLLDSRRYTFTLVRREFVGEARTFVIDVRPTKNPRDGFSGRIWIEDRGYNIVRFNGINRRAEREFFRQEMSFHVDSWRTNVLPGLWLPSYIYVEQTNTDGATGARGAHLRSHVRLWGYDPRTAQPSADAFTDILIDAPQVQDTAARQAQLSPVSSARQWEAEAEDNVVQRLERASLIAAPGEAEKVLETVVNNLEVTNDIVNDPPLKVRVLLTTPLESFTAGRTIILSRGLIDVLPDEASLAMMLAHELAHVVLGHPLIDPQFAFSDRLMVDDEELLRLLKVTRTAAEEAAADAKVMEMLEKSPYKDALAGSGLFLRIVADRAKVLPNLITPHIGDHIAEGGQIMRLAQVMEAAPELNRERLDQVAALSLGARLALNPWNARLELIRNAAELPESAREKVPLTIAPLIPYLRYVDAPPLLRP